MLAAWQAMLADLEGGTPEGFVDWFAIECRGGREADVAMRRHWVDPTRPFAEAVLGQAHGVLVTSASLRDDGGPADGGLAGGSDEASPDSRRRGRLAGGGGTNRRPPLALPARRASVKSPFDYPGQTRVLIVRDVRREDTAQVAAAYRELFLAAGGGGLGLFTAISRLRRVHEQIAPALADAGISLLAQHVDAMDTGTLVDIFRAETDACLLGTDAVRDGVDVPGTSLRLIIFDRVPWPRPDILPPGTKGGIRGPALRRPHRPPCGSNRPLGASFARRRIGEYSSCWTP